MIIKERRSFKDFAGKKARKLVADLKSMIPIRVRYNSPYSAQDYREALTKISLQHDSAESFCGELSPDSILRNMFYSLERMEFLAECIIDRQLSLAKERGAFRAPLDIALDFFCVPYYGKERNEFIVGGKHKNGTNYFFSWLMADAVVQGERFCMGFEPRMQWSRKEEIIENLISRILRMRIPIGTILMDREFPGFRVLEILMRHGIRFIAAVKDDPRIKRAKDALKKSRNNAAFIPYELHKDGRMLSVNLILVKRDNEVYSWLTNIDGKPYEIVEKYKLRWGTETNNRERNKYRARTTSNRYEWRYLLFMMSVALHNVWILTNFLLSIQLYGFAADPLLRSYEFKRVVLAAAR